MPDIVERLGSVAQAEREVAMDADMRPEDTINGEYAKTCDDAADEITRLRVENERLRKALTQIASHYDRIYYPGELSFEFAEIARKALKGDSE